MERAAKIVLRWRIIRELIWLPALAVAALAITVLAAELGPSGDVHLHDTNFVFTVPPHSVFVALLATLLAARYLILGAAVCSTKARAWRVVALLAAISALALLVTRASAIVMRFSPLFARLTTFSAGVLLAKVLPLLLPAAVITIALLVVVVMLGISVAKRE